MRGGESVTGGVLADTTMSMRKKQTTRNPNPPVLEIPLLNRPLGDPPIEATVSENMKKTRKKSSEEVTVPTAHIAIKKGVGTGKSPATKAGGNAHAPALLSERKRSKSMVPPTDMLTA